MTLKLCAIGEPMIELAPVEGGLYRQGFAGDTFNTAWHMAQVLGPRARSITAKRATDMCPSAQISRAICNGGQ